jgi:hypothetical protein
VSTSFSPAIVTSGGSTTLTITATNGEAGDATGVRTAMHRSSYLTLTGQSGDATCSETTGPNLITCDFGTLAGNTSEDVALVFTITYPGWHGFAVSNYLRTDAWSPSSASWWANSSVTFLGTDLALSATPPKKAASKGKESTFTFTVSNLGPNASGGVKVDAWTNLAASGTYVSASGANCTPSNNDSAYVECDVGTIPNGQLKTFSITYLCNLEGKRTFGVEGSTWSTSEPDPVLSNNEASASVKTVGKQ